jgi:ABC-type nitrate/sulfonate/bicarbonate transport system permease component
MRSLSPSLRPLLPLRGLLPLALLLAIWQILASASSPYFPPPSTWHHSVIALLNSGRLIPALFSTLGTFIVGLLLSVLVGFSGGIILGRSSVARRALGPLLEFCRGVPPPLLLPVAVLFLGYSENLKLLNVVWVATWPILLNTAGAAAHIEELLLDVCKNLHMGPMARFWKVIAPAAIPEFLVGVRVAIPLAIIIALLVEMMTGLPGIGSLIVTAQRQFRSAEVYGLLVLIGLIGFVANTMFMLISNSVLTRWPPTSR